MPDLSSSCREADLPLIERAQRGDKTAFDALVLKYRRRLVRLLTRWVWDAGEVEDIVQESFLKAYKALSLFRRESAFYTWIYRIGVNTAKNHLAEMRRRVPTVSQCDDEEFSPLHDGEQPGEADTPEHLMVSKQMASVLNETLEELPEELRTAIVLREIDGLSYGDIAARMKCPTGTVRSRIFRAREAFASRLRPLIEARNGERW